MKVMDQNESITAKSDRVIPPPPPPSPVPRSWAKKNSADSVTKQEIARFWRQKRIEEEEHLLAAIKAAARLRARNLIIRVLMMLRNEIGPISLTRRSFETGREPAKDTPTYRPYLISQHHQEDGYKLFEKSLDKKDEDGYSEQKSFAPAINCQNSEVRVGIKDWWTKSKYAYLNQPAIESTDALKRRASSYIPNFFNREPTPLYPTAIGAF